MVRHACVASIVLLTGACAVGPNYQRPPVPVPAKYKELPTVNAAGSEWKPAQPQDDAARGKWWEVFGDADLDALEARIAVSNQTVAQAEAQYRSARALARVARAAFFPTLSTVPSVTRSSGVTTHSSATPGVAAPTVTAYSVPVDLSWEVDVFGRIRRNVEAGVAAAQASAADLAAVRLAIEAELAADYFALHGLDAQKQLLDSTVDGYRTALQLTENRYKQGIVSGVDVAQAQTQLETTRAAATDLGIARAQLEHAIAVLVGQPPGDFTIPPGPIRVAAPEIPVGIPSELLERRPDIAGAERLVAGANAQIGVVRAAYFPILTLAALGGYQSSTLSNFFSLPNRFWSLGPTLLETLFDGGKRRAVSEQVWASYDAAVAAYRESVLAAFQEVEDNLAALRILAEEATQQADAVAAAERSLAMAKNRYQGGITTYLEVVTAQTVALANERNAVDLLTRQMAASVNLVKALGGGWRTSDLPYGGVSSAGAAAPARKQPAPAQRVQSSAPN